MKTVKRYTVIQSLSEEALKSIGFERWARKNIRLVTGFFIVAVLILILRAAIKELNTEVMEWVSGGVIALMVGLWFYNMVKARNEFWKKVKDLPEPIDLREVK